MKCTEVRENMIEGLGSQPNAPVAAHLASCAECAQVWAGLQATFAAMDDWKSPEPSPFFQTRLNARLADVKWEESSAPTGISGGCVIRLLPFVLGSAWPQSQSESRLR